ncbi:MAG: hypothetical protein JXM72_12325, partial [Deltaproteobacteria bacterium]|nr:hypothetical protein [Deltaproteobacteria bacterium]
VPGTTCLHALDLPDDAFVLLAEAAADPCSICAEHKQIKAFEIMNRWFVPGKEIQTDERCLLIKTAAADDNEFSLNCYPSVALNDSLTTGEQPPQIVFTFYTPQKRLVGISETDYTDRPLADLFHASKPGTVYEGRIRLIPYTYGDGPAYIYFQQRHKLMIHCRVLELKPVSSGLK